MDSLKTLFSYLDAEQIYVDKEEFDFQFNSHPDFPSLLAMCDTLKFFNISNGAFKIDKSDIDLLPNKFIAKLKKDNTGFLSYVEKRNNIVTYSNGTEHNYSISKNNFESLWDDIVLFAEVDETLPKPKSKNWLTISLLILSVLLFVSILLITLPNVLFGIFYIFPIIGMLFSIAALKDLFNTKNKILDKFCNATATTSCYAVVNSSKWKIFNVISFSDLSILFFSSQIGTLFLIGLTKQNMDFFTIQTLLLLLATPILATSIYYQKYIEKKWCPICLMIIGIILVELCYIITLNTFTDFSISLFSLLLFLATGTLLTSIWVPLKSTLKKVNHLQKIEQKGNRFKRNYTLFKKMLATSEYYDLPKSQLIFGNQNATLNITIITSPYCGHCKEPHYMLKSILDKYGEKLNVSILYNLNPKHLQMRTFLKNLFVLGKENQQQYYEAMEYWYETKDDEKWLCKYQINTDTTDIEINLDYQHSWFGEHSLNFTPCLFINGYQFPKEYDIADLPFFIDELIDDDSIEKYILKIAETEKLK